VREGGEDELRLVPRHCACPVRALAGLGLDETRHGHSRAADGMDFQLLYLLFLIFMNLFIYLY
jgi:hypothetical protein